MLMSPLDRWLTDRFVAWRVLRVSDDCRAVLLEYAYRPGSGRTWRWVLLPDWVRDEFGARLEPLRGVPLGGPAAARFAPIKHNPLQSPSCKIGTVTGFATHASLREERGVSRAPRW